MLSTTHTGSPGQDTHSLQVEELSPGEAEFVVFICEVEAPGTAGQLLLCDWLVPAGGGGLAERQVVRLTQRVWGQRAEVRGQRAKVR